MDHGIHTMDEIEGGLRLAQLALHPFNGAVDESILTASRAIPASASVPLGDQVVHDVTPKKPGGPGDCDFHV
jgi:hypothetical protein